MASGPFEPDSSPVPIRSGHPLPEGEGRKSSIPRPSADSTPSPAASLSPQAAPEGRRDPDKSGRDAGAPGKRAYRRHKPFQMTQARREAAKANLARGREVLRQRG